MLQNFMTVYRDLNGCCKNNFKQMIAYVNQRKANN